MFSCRECEREINQATEICPYCGSDLTEAGLPESSEPATKPSLSAALLRWGMLLAVLSAALWGFLWYILPERSGSPATQAEVSAVEALTEFHAVLSAYAAAQGSGYPSSLEILGDRARGPAQKALSEGYELQYTPGPMGSDAVVHNYILLARPRNYGYRNFYMDETGTLRATSENRPASAQDPPI